MGKFKRKISGSKGKRSLEINNDPFEDRLLDDYWQTLEGRLTEQQILECKAVRNRHAFMLYIEEHDIPVVFLAPGGQPVDTTGVDEDEFLVR